jgi:hypothetical protein
MQDNIDQLVILNFKIPDYDIIDRNITGFEDEQQKKDNGQDRTSPLISGCDQSAPRIGDLGKISQNNAAHKPTYRQLWFQKHVLRQITKETVDSRVPWRFRTSDGKCWHLDKGSVCGGSGFLDSAIS